MMFNATFNNMGRKPKYTYLSVILLFLLQFYIHVILTLRVGLRCLTPPQQYFSYIVAVGCFDGGTRSTRTLVLFCYCSYSFIYMFIFSL